MITTLLHLLHLFPFLCGGHRHLAPENLALRQQLALYKRRANRLTLRTSDRFFWVCLSRVWAGWRQALVIVTPDTVLRWQRQRFRLHWTKLSGRPTGGRPPVHHEIRTLVSRMAEANPLWGAPRIHGELLKLGIDVAERTISRLIPKRRLPPSQTVGTMKKSMETRSRTWLVRNARSAPFGIFQGAGLHDPLPDADGTQAADPPRITQQLAFDAETFLAVFVDDKPWPALAKFGIHALVPQVKRLEDVAVRVDHLVRACHRQPLRRQSNRGNTTAAAPGAGASPSLGLGP